MATRKKAEPEKDQPKEAAAEAAPQDTTPTLQKAAKAIGSALGTMAVKTGIATPPKKKIGKLVKKNKARLPRKEKKAAKKKKVAKQAR
jgi:hypothetical protein